MVKSEEPKSTETNQVTPEEYIQEVTIGERQPRNSTIYLSSYDPGWPSQFKELAKRVRLALEEKVLMLEHVGSTSIPGLSAKPIIDLVLVVADSRDEPSYLPTLENQGFCLRIREADWHEHRLLKSRDIKANLHVFSKGCPEVDRMLVFRDWLRSNPADRRLYERTKQKLAARTWEYTQHYADAKTEVIEGILKRAGGGTG